MNQYFTVSISVFLEKIFQKIRSFQCKTPFCQKNTSFYTEKEVLKQKRAISSEIVFYSGNLSFPTENLLENPFFPLEKTVLSEKYKFFPRKRGFQVEKSNFILNSILQWKPQFSQRKSSIKYVFFIGKDRFVRKIQVLTTKTWFSSRKEYFNLKQYFTVETSVFLEKIFQKTRFFQWKIPFCQKNTSFNSENFVFKQKCVL